MLHFTCDMCGRVLKDDRYVARIEVRPAFDPEELTDADLDADHLHEISEILDNDVTGESAIHEDARDYRFDLCQSCLRRYTANPLGRDVFRRVPFSDN